jgi:RsiW-degrading membrane proteinase PrsW (M82 family)
MELVILKCVTALAPVVVFLLVFSALDAFKLMSWTELFTYLALGGALAAASYFANWRAMDELPIGFTNYTKYFAPIVEETLKASLVLFLFARNRIGFMIDAAITGFSIGAGFSLIENVFYLYYFSEANLGVWLVRGFGTAVMHGGATAIFGVMGQFLTERQLKVEEARYRFNVLPFIPGLIGAIVLHSTFNHFPNQPVLAMGVTILVVPLTLIFLFSKSEHSAHEWLVSDYATHQEMLAEIRDGRFAESPEGRVILSLSQRFGPPTMAAIFEYIQLHTELVVRAEKVLIAHEEGEDVTLGPEVREKFQRLHALERQIGRTALLTVRPHLHFSRNDLWEMNELEEDARRVRVRPSN